MTMRRINWRHLKLIWRCRTDELRDGRWCYILTDDIIRATDKEVEVMKKPSNNQAKTAAKIVAGLAATAALCLNVNGCVYGPSQEEETTRHHDPVSNETTVFDPQENEVPAVYGPPSDETFDPDDNQNADVYGPPEDFDPSSNEAATVYGPPSDMVDDTDETEDTEPDSIVETETSQAHEADS